MVHCHPSGDPTPSPEDVRLTSEAGEAGVLLGIDVLDHVVIAGDGFVSLCQAGLYIPPPPAGSSDDTVSARASHRLLHVCRSSSAEAEGWAQLASVRDTGAG